MFGFGKKKYQLGIALGGGGARGYAHLGVLKALYEKGIRPDIVSGVSAGSIAGAFIADGHSPEDAFEIMKKYNFTGLTKFMGFKSGLLSLSKMKGNLEKKITAKRIEDTDIPFIVGVSNMLDGTAEYISSGHLATAVQASSSIPVLFSPVKINNKLYNDGGLFDNLPISPLEGQCKKIIAVSISPVQKIKQMSNLKDVALRMFQLAINPQKDEVMEACDVFIEPPELSEFDIMDTKNAQEIFNIGYNHVKKMDIDL